MPRPTPFPPTRALLVTCGLATAWIPTPASGQTVTQEIPVDSEFGALGTGWINRFGQNLDIPDIDGDGAVTNSDFTAWLGFRLGDIPLIGPVPEAVPLDPEDVPPCQQAALALADYLRLVAGDVTLDGVVDQADVAALTPILAQIQASPALASGYGVVIRYDVNQDNVVDQHDMMVVMDHQGTVLGDDPLTVAQSAVATTPECGGGAPPPTPWEGHYRHPTHDVFFSESYPVHEDGTSRELERRIIPQYLPNDHEAMISLSWPEESSPPVLPNHQIFHSKMFPPNHYFDFSQTWPHEYDVHDVDASRKWPPNHYKTYSSTWYPTVLPPGEQRHDTRLSAQWDANHQVDVSRLPEVHDGQHSAIRNRSPHHESISAHWTHARSHSLGAWPPNHLVNHSGGWSHSFNFSSVLPPNHFSGPSSTWTGPNSPWPDRVVDPRWPANHYAALSLHTLPPVDPQPLIPPDLYGPSHHLWITGQDIAPHVQPAPQPE